MMTQHTPGPWMPEEDGRYVWADAVSTNGEEYDQWIAEIDPDAQLLGRETEMKANARLIASAPDMAKRIERQEATLKSIRVYLRTFDRDALGVDPEVGFSYRDEMVDSIDKALEVE